MATTTPNYGWDVPTSTDYVKDGATAIETLGDDIDSTLWTALGGAYPGLRLIKKQTIGSGVSSVTVTNAFSATYENYKIVISGGVCSGNFLIGLKLGSTATGYYTSRNYSYYANNTVAGQGLQNYTSFIFAGMSSTSSLTMDVTLQNPFTSKVTMCNGAAADPSTAGVQWLHGGFLNNTTSYTDFDIFSDGGTLTGGTIYVYGYGAS